VDKLRRAFLWLKDNNPLYKDVTWSEEAVGEWKVEDPNLPTREEELSGKAVVTAAEFRLWMHHAELNHLEGAVFESSSPEAGDANFVQIGRKLHEHLAERSGAADASGHGGEISLWNVLRRVVAERLDKNAYRAASSLTMIEIAMAGAFLGVLDLGDLDAQDVTREDLEGLDEESWSDDLVQLRV